MIDDNRPPFWARIPMVGNLGYPIALKEVRSLIRRNRYFWAQFIYLIILASGVLITVVAAVDENTDRQGISRQVFLLFFGIQLYLVFLVFPAFASTAISSERVEKSFDLLATTDLTPAEIVWGKFLGIFGNCCYFLLVTLPILGTCILFGGAPIRDAVLSYAGLVAIAGILTAYGLMVSSWAKTNMRAILITYVPVVALLMFMFNKASFDGLMSEESPVMALLEKPELLKNLLLGSFVFFAFCFVSSVQMLTSSEGNRATPMRILVVIGVMLTLFLASSNLDAWLQGSLKPSSGGGFTSKLTAGSIVSRLNDMATLLFVLLTPFVLCFSGGRTDTPMRVTQQSNRHPRRMYASWILLPGGVRGVVYSSLVIAVVLIGMELLAAPFSGALVGVVSAADPEIDGMYLGDSVVAHWRLLSLGLLTYCALAFLVSAMGVRGVLNLVIVLGFMVLANLYAAVLEQDAEAGEQSVLRPLSVLVTLMNARRETQLTVSEFLWNVNVSAIVHGALTVVLLTVGCLIMRAKKSAVLVLGMAASSRPRPDLEGGNNRDDAQEALEVTTGKTGSETSDDTIRRDDGERTGP